MRPAYANIACVGPLDNFVRIRKEKRAIQEDPDLSSNMELYQYAEKNQLDLPTKHVLSVMRQEYLMKDFEKNTISRMWFPDTKSLDMAFEVLEQRVSHYVTGRSTMLTYEEAIDRMELSTSPGYPWNKNYQTKREVMEKMGNEVKDAVERVMKGEMVDAFLQTSPKVEIVSREKAIQKRKTRSFMCVDIVTYIVGLMLYGEQNDALLSMAYTHDYSAVGMSPFHGGWDWIAKHLTDGDSLKKLLCMDVSAMEACISANLFQRWYRIRNSKVSGNGKVTEQQKENLMRWYFLTIVYSLVIDPEGWLGINIGVNPSGQLNTLMDNTMVLMVMILYCFARKCKHIEDLWDMYLRNHIKCMGDDSIGQDTPDLRLVLQYGHEIGFSKPDGSSAITIESEGSLKDARFLNFGFHYHEPAGMYVMEPNYDKMYASIYLYFKSRSWRLTLAKLYSIRVFMWPYPHHRNQIDLLIGYILSKHDATLQGETRLDSKITYKQLKSLDLTDDAIRYLIFGFEGSRILNESTHFSIGHAYGGTTMTYMLALSDTWDWIAYTGLLVGISSVAGQVTKFALDKIDKRLQQHHKEDKKRLGPQ